MDSCLPCFNQLLCSLESRRVLERLLRTFLLPVSFNCRRSVGADLQSIKDFGSSPFQAAYSSEILYIITLWLTKCSVAFLLLRLSPQKEHNLASYAILGASTLFMVISVFIVAFRCDVAEPWIFINTQCTNLVR